MSVGTIRKFPSGNWNVQIRRVGHPNVSKTFNSKAEAIIWMRQTETEIDKGGIVQYSRVNPITLGEALNRYLREVTPNKKGAVEERIKISRWLRHPISKAPLAALRPIDFASYRDKRLTEVSNATVRLELAVISHLYTVAIKEWSFEGMSNPVASIRKPKPSNARNRRLSDDEMKRLLLACGQSKNKQLLPLVRLALETAMRLGELMSLRWKQVGIESRTIILYDTKNGDDRTIPMSSRVIDILQDMAKDKSSERVFYLWAERSDCIKKSWEMAKEKAGIEDFHFHDLRHEATSRLFELGLNVMEVASITGHKSMQMLRRYTHPRISDLVRKLDASDEG